VSFDLQIFGLVAQLPQIFEMKKLRGGLLKRIFRKTRQAIRNSLQ
jgi:hypothetical protein